MSTISHGEWVFCLDQYDEYEHINCGAGSDVTIAELARLVKDAVGYSGELVMDPSKAGWYPAEADGFGPHSRAGLAAGNRIAQTGLRRPIAGSSTNVADAKQAAAA